MADTSKPGSTEAPQPQSTGARKASRSTGPVIMVAGLALALTTVLFVPLMTGGATGSQASSGTVSSTVVTVAAYQSVDAAAEALDYVPALPAAPDDARVTSVNVLDGKTLEVVYSFNGNAVVYRTAPGADDLSGVYTEYACTLMEEAGGVARSYGGASESKLNLAVWAHDGYAYSLYAESGIEAEVLRSLAQSL